MTGPPTFLIVSSSCVTAYVVYCYRSTYTAFVIFSLRLTRPVQLHSFKDILFYFIPDCASLIRTEIGPKTGCVILYPTLVRNEYLGTIGSPRGTMSRIQFYAQIVKYFLTEISNFPKQFMLK